MNHEDMGAYNHKCAHDTWKCLERDANSVGLSLDYSEEGGGAMDLWRGGDDEDNPEMKVKYSSSSVNDLRAFVEGFAATYRFQQQRIDYIKNERDAAIVEQKSQEREVGEVVM